MDRLPAKRSKGVQRRHTRRLKTRDGFKDVLVNPGVRKPLQPRVPSVPKPSVGVGSSRRVSGLALPKSDPLVPKSSWRDVLKPDDGSARPISSPFVPPAFNDAFDFVLENTGPYVCRNEDDFAKEVEDLLNDLYARVEKGEVSKDEWDSELYDVRDKLESMIYDTELEPELTVTYSGDSEDPDPGYIYRYTTYNVEGLDVRWVSDGGYRGHEELEVDPNGPWFLVHSDVVLGMSADAENLKLYEESLVAELDSRGIRWARAISPTSNLFAVGYDFLVERDRSAEAVMLSEALKRLYRKPEDFEAEVNPLYSSVRDAVRSGRSRAELVSLAESADDPELRRVLLRAIERSLGGGSSE